MTLVDAYNLYLKNGKDVDKTRAELTEFYKSFEGQEEIRQSYNKNQSVEMLVEFILEFVTGGDRA